MYVDVLVGLNIGCDIKWALCHYYQRYLIVSRGHANRIR